MRQHGTNLKVAIPYSSRQVSGGMEMSIYGNVRS